MQKTILERIERVADDVVSLVLRGDEGPLAPWEPGAHIDLALPNWLTRQYSLCGDPADLSAYRIAVRHDRLSRGGSEYVHLFLRPGRTLEVSLPRNHFPLRPASEYLFLAGGIGITPLLPMIDEKSFAGHFLGTIDLFVIWQMVVLAIGLGVLYRRRTQPIATSLLVVYAVIAIVVAFVKSRAGGA